MGKLIKNVTGALGLGSDPAKRAAEQAAKQAEQQRQQFQAQTDALNAQQQLASQNKTENVVQVESGSNEALVGDNPLVPRKKRPAALSSSLGL